jgi:hypothetical protein
MLDKIPTLLFFNKTSLNFVYGRVSFGGTGSLCAVMAQSLEKTI